MSEFSTAIEAMRGKQIVGVYRIALSDSRCYVGSTKNIRQRWNIHYRLLKRGAHHSPYLQSAWDKYGEDAFRIDLIQTCELEDLARIEQFWMDTLRSDFNVFPFARRTTGQKHSLATRQKLSEMRSGTTMPQETRDKISAAMAGREQVGGFHGKQHTPESRAKISVGNSNHVRSDEHSNAISDAKIATRGDTCKHGHLLVGDNIHWRLNFRGTWVRRCRACHRDQVRRARLKAKERATNDDG